MNYQYIKSNIKTNFPATFASLRYCHRLLDQVKSYFINLYKNRHNCKGRYKVTAIKSWAHANRLPYHVLEKDRRVYLTAPDIISTLNELHSFKESSAILPEVYLAKLANVTVIAGYDLIVAKKKIALYDEVAHDREGRYGPRIGVIALIIERFVESSEALLEYKNSRQRLPDRAIHFCKDYSYNYFHWLIEALPRLWVIDQFRELDGLPLLVDGGLLPQQLEALKMLTADKREIIELKLGQGYKIKNLYYPSGLSSIHNNYDHPIQYDKDIVVAPAAIDYLRSKFLSTVKAQPAYQYPKKIFLSRKNSSDMRLLNSEEIEIYLAKEGFDIIYPELLSFADQIRIFSQAEVIIGAAGSAMANIIFASELCTVFILSNPNRFNPYLFSTISHCKLYFILGEETLGDKMHSRGAHNPFKVDLNLIKDKLFQSSSS